jgi:hypothetical protein
MDDSEQSDAMPPGAEDRGKTSEWLFRLRDKMPDMALEQQDPSLFELTVECALQSQISVISVKKSARSLGL